MCGFTLNLRRSAGSEDQELPAAEAVQKEEARALTEEKSCWEEPLISKVVVLSG